MSISRYLSDSFAPWRLGARFVLMIRDSSCGIEQSCGIEHKSLLQGFKTFKGLKRFGATGCQPTLSAAPPELGKVLSTMMVDVLYTITGNKIEQWKK